MKPAALSVTKIKDFVTNKQIYPYFALGFVALIFLVTSIVIFIVTLRSLNLTFEERRDSPVLPIRVNFDAIDTVALKLGIEIPVRDIPSRETSFVNAAPVIFNFTSVRSQVLPGETITIFLNAYDPENDELDVSWKATDGILTPIGPYGPVRWKAPQNTGNYAVTVALTDNQQGRTPVSANISIDVIPKPPGEEPAQEIPQFATRLVGLVKEEGDPTLYLVKTDYLVKTMEEKLYKRVVVDPKILDFYGHLDINSVEIVPPGTLGEYTLSNWIRGKDKTKVYKVNPDLTKQWYKMTFGEFETTGGSDPAVFTVNEEELRAYADGEDILQ